MTNIRANLLLKNGSIIKGVKLYYDLGKEMKEINNRGEWYTFLNKNSVHSIKGISEMMNIELNKYEVKSIKFK